MEAVNEWLLLPHRLTRSCDGRTMLAALSAPVFQLPLLCVAPGCPRVPDASVIAT
jgi:hypothetical protein